MSVSLFLGSFFGLEVGQLQGLGLGDATQQLESQPRGRGDSWERQDARKQGRGTESCGSGPKVAIP